MIQAFVAAGVSAVLTACGSTLTGTASLGEIDVHTLDIGAYPVEPRDAYEVYLPDLAYRNAVGIMRLADNVASAFDIDPRLKSGYTPHSFTSSDEMAEAAAPNRFGAPQLFGPIVTRHKMLFGFESEGSDTRTTISSSDDWPTKTDKNSTTITSIVMQFPDSSTAELAAADLYEADLGLQRDRNAPVAIPKYHAALAQWRPGEPFIRAMAAHGSYVVAFVISTPAPDIDALVALTQKAYDAQLPLLDRLQPLSDEEVLQLPWDPDGLLNRALNPTRVFNPTFDDEQALFSPRGLRHYAQDRALADQRYTGMAADRFAVSYGTIIARASDPAAAEKVVQNRVMPFPYTKDIDPPPRIPTAACVENEKKKVDFHLKRFTCVVAYRQFIGFVSADQIIDAQQRAAAQYALFANAQ